MFGLFLEVKRQCKSQGSPTKKQKRRLADERLLYRVQFVLSILPVVLFICMSVISLFISNPNYIIGVDKNNREGKGYPKLYQTFEACFNELPFISIALKLLQILN